MIRTEPSAPDFDEFYRDEIDGLRRALALAVGSHDLGGEAADEAMVHAYQHWRKIREYDNPTAWAYRVGLNWSRSRFRKRKREDIGSGPERGTLHRTLERVDPGLERALSRLGPDHRSVVVCRYLLDWSVEDTALALGVAPGTVKSRLSRAAVGMDDQPVRIAPS